MKVQSQFIEMFKDKATNATISSVSVIVSGKSIPKKLEDIKGSFAYVKVADFNINGNEKHITTSSRFVTNNTAKLSMCIPIGSVVFAKNGAASLSNKKRITGIECCIDMNTMAIIPKDNILSEFLYAIVNSIDLSKYVRQGAIPSISPKSIEKICFYLPSLKEQQQFVSIAEQSDKSKFVGLKSQFIEMFGKDSDFTELDKIVEIKDDCRKPLNDAVRSAMKDGQLYPYYGANGVVDYINDYLTDEQLLCIAEDCGNYKAGEDSSYIIQGKAWVNNHAHIVKMKESCSIHYLHQYLKIVDLMPYVSGTTRLKLTQKKLKEVSVLLPPFDKQLKFVSIAEQADKSKYFKQIA